MKAEHLWKGPEMRHLLSTDDLLQLVPREEHLIFTLSIHGVDCAAGSGVRVCTPPAASVFVLFC
jgi:hypothetical protein